MKRFMIVLMTSAIAIGMVKLSFSDKQNDLYMSDDETEKTRLDSQPSMEEIPGQPEWLARSAT
jgi:hypothetical protein